MPHNLFYHPPATPAQPDSYMSIMIDAVPSNPPSSISILPARQYHPLSGHELSFYRPYSLHYNIIIPVGLE